MKHAEEVLAHIGEMQAELATLRAWKVQIEPALAEINKIHVLLVNEPAAQNKLIGQAVADVIADLKQRAEPKTGGCSPRPELLAALHEGNSSGS